MRSHVLIMYIAKLPALYTLKCCSDSVCICVLEFVQPLCKMIFDDDKFLLGKFSNYEAIFCWRDLYFSSSSGLIEGLSCFRAVSKSSWWTVNWPSHFSSDKPNVCVRVLICRREMACQGQRQCMWPTLTFFFQKSHLSSQRGQHGVCTQCIEVSSCEMRGTPFSKRLQVYPF